MQTTSVLYKIIKGLWNDMIIFLSGFLSGFRIFTWIFLNFSLIFRFQYLHRIDGLLLKYEMIIFLSEILSGYRMFSRFFWIFLKSSDFNAYDHISSQYWWFNSQIWYNNSLFRQGPIESGHVLISWSNTSNSARCVGDALRCVASADQNMAPHNRPLEFLMASCLRILMT